MQAIPCDSFISFYFKKVYILTSFIVPYFSLHLCILYHLLPECPNHAFCQPMAYISFKAQFESHLC